MTTISRNVKYRAHACGEEEAKDYTKDNAKEDHHYSYMYETEGSGNVL